MKTVILSLILAFTATIPALSKAADGTEPATTTQNDNNTPVGKGTVISFREDITFKNKGKTDLAILLTSVNNKNCAFSVGMKKGASYTITTDQKIVFKGSRKGVSQMKHPHTVYMFAAPGNRTVELACTDRTDLTFGEVLKAWEFRGESAVFIKTE